MKKDSLSHKNFLLKDYYKNTQIKKAFDKIFKEINDRCDDTKNTYHVLSKKFNFDFKINYLKKYKKFKNIVIVGMGGSVLGSNAIYDFLKHKIKKKFYFLDNLNSNCKKFPDSDNLNIIISKSGNTLETIVNSNIYIKKKHNNTEDRFEKIRIKH